MYITFKAEYERINRQKLNKINKIDHENKINEVDIYKLLVVLVLRYFH